jgi:hypothetical protein
MRRGSFVPGIRIFPLSNFHFFSDYNIAQKLQKGLSTLLTAKTLKWPGQCALFYIRLIINKEDKRGVDIGKLG